MKTTTIKYGKILTVMTEDNGVNTIEKGKVSELPSILSDLECFSLQLSNTVLKKTVKLIDSLGFDIHEIEGYGFDWETKLVCTK